MASIDMIELIFGVIIGMGVMYYVLFPERCKKAIKELKVKN